MAFPTRLVDDMTVALDKGSTPAILPGKTYRKPFIKEAGKSQMLGAAPVNITSGLVTLPPAREHALHGLMDIDTFRYARDRIPQLFQARLCDTRFPAPVVIDWQTEAGPLSFQPVSLVGPEILSGLEGIIQERLKCLDLGIELGFGEDSLRYQALAIDFPCRGAILDDTVHDRLGHCRIIALIMTETTIAEHVDDDVLREFLPVFGSHLGRVDNRFRIVSIDMEDRRLDHQRDI